MPLHKYDLTSPKKGIWSYIKPDMINPQKGIGIYDNKSIIIRIFFAITIFQQVHLMWATSMEKFPHPSFIIIQQMRGYNLQ